MGADMLIRDAIGKYPIHTAVSSGSLNCLRVMLEHEDSKNTDEVGSYHLPSSAKFQQLINLSDSEGETALHLAVNSGNIEMIEVSSNCNLLNLLLNSGTFCNKLELVISLT